METIYELEDGTPVPNPELVNCPIGTVLVNVSYVQTPPQYVSVQGHGNKLKVRPCHVLASGQPGPPNPQQRTFHLYYNGLRSQRYGPVYEIYKSNARVV